MEVTVRRLGPGDGAILAMLGSEDEDFDLAERPSLREPLSAEAAQAYLTEPSVLHWIAEADGEVVGHMSCHLLRKRASPSAEILLYEIGVREAHRRRRVGSALIECLRAWMRNHGVEESWVLADNPGAVEFYQSCGFEALESPTYLQHRLTR